MQKYKKYIHKGVNQPLSQIPFHGLSEAPLKRLLMMGEEIQQKAESYIAVHLVKNLPKKILPYCEMHSHNHDELNLIISENKKLTYQIQLANESYIVTSPSSIFIPKGLKHKAEVLKGEGIFISIIFNGKYKALKK